jgi:hypothetical protein
MQSGQQSMDGAGLTISQFHVEADNMKLTQRDGMLLQPLEGHPPPVVDEDSLKLDRSDIKLCEIHGSSEIPFCVSHCQRSNARLGSPSKSSS